MGLEQFTAYSDTASLNNILFIVISTFSLVGYLSLNKIYFFTTSLNLKFLTIRAVLLLSYIFTIVALVNFLIPINDYISATFYLIGIVIFIIKFLNKELILEFKWIILIIFFIFIYIFQSGYNNDFDYHSHHILLFKNYNILDFNGHIMDGRVKYNSAYLLINAITYLSFLPFSIKFLSSFILATFILDIRSYFKTDNNVPHLKPLSLFFLISIFITLSKFKNIGTDYIAHIFFLSLLFFYLYVLSFKKDFFLNKSFLLIATVSCTFMVMLKISMVLSLLIVLHYLMILYQNKKTKNIFSLLVLSPFLIILPWVFQNLELSKCLIYPIKILCFVDENSISPIVFEHNMINLFAKSVKINYWNESIQYLIELNKFPNWLTYWLNDHFFKIIEKFVPILLLFYISLFKVTHRKSNYSNFLICYEFPRIFTIIFLIILGIWFLQAPAMRFGFSYLVVCFYLLAINILKVFNFSYVDLNKDNYYLKLTDILIALFFLYQILRII